jgi:hypothetical protein
VVIAKVVMLDFKEEGNAIALSLFLSIKLAKSIMRKEQYTSI